MHYIDRPEGGNDGTGEYLGLIVELRSSLIPGWRPKALPRATVMQSLRDIGADRQAYVACFAPLVSRYLHVSSGYATTRRIHQAKKLRPCTRPSTL